MKRPDEGTYRAMVETLAAALDQSYPASGALSRRRSSTTSSLANRMAAFIWGAEKPDASLMDAARRGALRNTAVLEQQVRRMLRDTKSDALVAGFFERWLLRDGLDKLATTTQRNPGFDETLRQAFATETRLFFRSQLREDEDAVDLWTANYTFVNERLARHYGILRFSGSGFRRVTLTDAARAGLLGKGSLLTVTSFADRTSPAVRGKFVMRLFYGLNPPDPPPNVPAAGRVERPADEGTDDRGRHRPGVRQLSSDVHAARVRDGQLRPDRRVANRSGRIADRRDRRVPGRHAASTGRPSCVTALLRTRDAYYTNITRLAARLRARPRGAGVAHLRIRDAGRARRGARGRVERLPLVGDRARHRQEHAVPDQERRAVKRVSAGLKTRPQPPPRLTAPSNHARARRESSALPPR